MLNQFRVTTLTTALVAVILWALFPVPAAAQIALGQGIETSRLIAMRDAVDLGVWFLMPRNLLGKAPTVSQPKVTGYTLPPERYRQARDLGKIRFRALFFGFLYQLGAMWIILQSKIASKFRDWAEKAFKNRFLQAAVFVPLVFLVVGLAFLPLKVYFEWVYRSYGISIQSWGSWVLDWCKGQCVIYVEYIVVFWFLYTVIRKAPRRWWLYFWIVSLPVLLFVLFLTPLVIEPMFNKFQPLAGKQPDLVRALEPVIHRAGESIPSDRMYWMAAGEKTTALNAYVNGFGASKRIVIWDTTIAKLTTPQIVAVTGHELGHSVMHHLLKWLALDALSLFVALYFLYRCLGSLIAWKGPAWRIRGVDDWASLPAVMLLYMVFWFVSQPIINGVSRHFEHQADQFALDVTYGLTPDAGQVQAQALQILGEVDLGDPDPNPVDVFMFYDHPPFADRIRFALEYDPGLHNK